jgi:ferredoxin
MTAKTLTKEKFRDFVSNIARSERTLGVKDKDGKFDFGVIEDGGDLVLDYDVTLTPPKAFFQPASEKLFDFNVSGKTELKPNFDAAPLVIIGVHTYDLRAINQMDRIWADEKKDNHYFARRNSATIVAVEPTRASKWSFWATLDTGLAKSGFDLLLTDIGNKYVIEVGTEKGSSLLEKYAASADNASPDDLKARDKARANINSLCKADRKINADAKGLSALVKKSYEHPIWEKQAEKCYSCGSCNLVCPTCYCFNVSDDIELDLAHGKRSRAWDGCLLSRFAKVGTGENFREERSERFRHRIFRKMAYVADKLGGELACVGCGRCSSVCLPDITDPVKVINEICK